MLFNLIDGLLTGAIDTLEHGPAYALDAAVNGCPSAERMLKSAADDFKACRDDYETEEADDLMRSEETSLYAEGGDITKADMDVLCDVLEEEILKSEIGQEQKMDMLKRLRKLCSTETNIMLVGATGCGKSSTINAMFACSRKDDIQESPYVEIAKVGSKADPETRDIERYRIGNLILWDTPGLGDGTQIDQHHRDVIRELLQEQAPEGNALIDLV